MSDNAWMELCEVSMRSLHDLEAKSLNAVLLQCPSSHHSELTSLLLQAIPSSHPSDDGTVYLNPLIYEFVISAAEIGGTRKPAAIVLASEVLVSIAPLQVKEYCHDVQITSKPREWTLLKVKEIIDLPCFSTISVTCIYHENSCSSSSVLERQLSFALEGRLIRTNTLLALPTISGTCLVTVTNISSSEDGNCDEVVYRVGSNRDFSLDVTHVEPTLAGVAENPMQSEWEQDCPGYKDVLEELIILSHLQGVAAPAGVLLTGCAGVGKSRLASCLAYHVSNSHNMNVQWVSAQDLLARASWATESDLLETLLPRTDKRCLLVIDDLQILASNDNEGDISNDPEALLVKNSILEALTRMTRTIPSPFILGIARAATQLPKELVRIGRLEKVVQINPPTQVQREDVLEFLLRDVKNSDKRRKWAETLASQTAGCVASDLCRLCADAWTRAWSRCSEDVEITWNDLRHVAFACVPSQLAHLDVTKTTAYPNDDADGPLDPLRVHEWSWRNFGGYSKVKKQLYRTVVMPWRRFMIETSGKSSEDQKNPIRECWVAPPSGVLFHGPPGVGKTLAASCLASSLGLHVVKVRASDVLDQWLGGSEAAIRSLFARARAASPCILFFDEIDAIACNREDEGSSVDVSSRILSTFLNEMDGISSGHANSGVLVVACTNRLETLDAAFLRPGRLDEHVFLSVPSPSDISDMLKLHLAKVPMDEDVNIIELAELLLEHNATGADVEGMCRDACSHAVREATQLTSNFHLTRSDFLAALSEWQK